SILLLTKLPFDSLIHELKLWQTLVEGVPSFQAHLRRRC
ncbi:hypothetical protein GCK32_010953, partial [Trichostrongylus colubriformis]